MSWLVKKSFTIGVVVALAGCSVSPHDAEAEANGTMAEPEDTGPSLARRTGSMRDWTSVAIAVSSPSPYPNNFRQSWVIDAPAGATGVRVHFKTLRTEKDFDFVNVYSQSAALVARYHGSQDGMTTPVVPGNKVTVELVTDRSITAAGFAIDRFDWQ